MRRPEQDHATLLPTRDRSKPSSPALLPPETTPTDANPQRMVLPTIRLPLLLPTAMAAQPPSHSRASGGPQAAGPPDAVPSVYAPMTQAGQIPTTSPLPQERINPPLLETATARRRGPRRPQLAPLAPVCAMLGLRGEEPAKREAVSDPEYVFVLSPERPATLQSRP